MEFYDEKDMAYWRKQAEEGNAVIIDIPVEMLLELDINEIRMPSTKNVKPEEIQAWLDTHREEFEKAHARISSGETGNGENTENREAGEKQEESDEEKVAKIMAETSFSEAQFAVIAQAMLDQLPARYLLCFLKKEYSPATMQQMYEYCRKMYTEEKRPAAPGYRTEVQT